MANTRSRALVIGGRCGGNRGAERRETSRARRHTSPSGCTATPSPDPQHQQQQPQNQNPPLPPPPPPSAATSLWPGHSRGTMVPPPVQYQNQYQPAYPPPVYPQYQHTQVGQYPPPYPPPAYQYEQRSVAQFQQPQYHPGYPYQAEIPVYPPQQPPQAPHGYPPVYQPYRPPVQQAGMSWYSQLKRNHMQEFHGNVDHSEAEEWLRTFEKSCRNLQIPEYEWAQLAVGFLLGAAESWADVVQSAHGRFYDWAGFKKMFYDEYFPASVQSELAGQLFRHMQGTMSVTEYTNKFNKLGRFHFELLKSEERKMELCKQGLSFEIRSGLLGFGDRELQEVGNNISYCGSRSFGTSQGSSRGAPQQQVRRFPARSAARPQVGGSQLAVRPPVGASEVARPQVTLGCYICGQQGHFARECPRRVSKDQPGSHSRAGPSKQVQMFAVDAREMEPEDDVISGEQDCEYFEEYVLGEEH